MSEAKIFVLNVYVFRLEPFLCARQTLNTTLFLGVFSLYCLFFNVNRLNLQNFLKTFCCYLFVYIYVYLNGLLTKHTHVVTLGMNYSPASF